MDITTQRTAIVTGASRGLGLALTKGLVNNGWHVIATARGVQQLRGAFHGPTFHGSALDGTDLAGDKTREQRSEHRVTVVPGDVTSPGHRQRLVDLAGGRLDLLVNNASWLGPSPLPALATVDLEAVRAVYETNLIAPLALTQTALPYLSAADGTILNISSDAATGAWPGWGVYGSSKAALDQSTVILGVEHPGLAVYTVDPGDMRTAMHAEAFPGEDISDRPLPDAVVPSLLRLLEILPPSGRYKAAEFSVEDVTATAETVDVA